MKKHNFNAGPSVLSDFCIENTAAAVKDMGNGMSILEISHRSKDFQAIIDEAVDLTKEIFNVPAGYSVLFLHGGASLQFCMIPYNLLQNKAAYLDTGEWSSKAIKEAKIFGNVEVVASSKEANYSFVPKDFVIPSDADYFHVTSNNTIFGTQLKKDLDSPVPMIADMSSDIFSRPVDISKYAMIYAGAQKNLGPSGVCIAIIKDEILGKVERVIPTMLDYRTHIKNGSMFNTPSTLAIYASLQSLKWLKSIGGLVEMEKRNIRKAELLYNEIDRNKLFKATAAKEDRSLMNICFVMNDEYKELEAAFSELASKNGMVGIKGHRSVGGFRASTYNALAESSVQALVDLMQEFEKNNL